MISFREDVRNLLTQKLPGQVKSAHLDGAAGIDVGHFRGVPLVDAMRPHLDVERL